MIITATQKNTRQTARKVRLVANQVRKLALVDAIKQLAVIERKSTSVVLKVLRQAIANAMHNHGFALADLTLKNILVTPGPQFKRFRIVSRGRSHSVVKRTCHVAVELEANNQAPIAPVVESVKEVVAAEKPKAATKKKAVASDTTKKVVKEKTAEKPAKKTTAKKV